MTPTGREVTLIEQATGTCVDNAEVIDSPTYLCKGDGKWSLPTGGCKCKAGFEPDFDKQTCNGKPYTFLIFQNKRFKSQTNNSFAAIQINKSQYIFFFSGDEKANDLSHVFDKFYLFIYKTTWTQ